MGTSKVTDMSWLISEFDDPINDGQDRTGRFEHFNADLSMWDVSNVTTMQGMFWDAQSFNSNISKWNVSKVTDMSYMLSTYGMFNGNISAWDVSKVVNMSNMFEGAKGFNSDISQWNVSKVTNMCYMFRYAESFSQELCWDMSQVENSEKMFYFSSGSMQSYPECQIRDDSKMIIDKESGSDNNSSKGKGK